MCYLVGERPSGRHPKRHWNDLLNYVHHVFDAPAPAVAPAPPSAPAPSAAPPPAPPAAAGAVARAAGGAAPAAAAPSPAAAAAAHFRWTVFSQISWQKTTSEQHPHFSQNDHYY